MSDQYFVRVRGKIQGPFDTQALQSMARRGKFARHHEVSIDGVDWHKAFDYPELFPERKKRKAKEEEEDTFEIYEEEDPGDSSSDSENDQSWQVVLDGKKYGPITRKEIEELVLDGSLPTDSHVWHPKYDGWKKINETQEFSHLTLSRASTNAPTLSHPGVPNSKYCHACGAIIIHTNHLCPLCGAPQTFQVTDKKNDGTKSLILGIISLFLWVIPILGAPIAIWGIVSGNKAESNGVSVTGITLSVIGLCLSILTFIGNLYLISTGQMNF